MAKEVLILAGRELITVKSCKSAIFDEKVKAKISVKYSSDLHNYRTAGMAPFCLHSILKNTYIFMDLSIAMAIVSSQLQ